jgi:predicted branched-subunit amino acid permease
MKKIYLIMCCLGVILPYYHLLNFLSQNNWSMNGFWGEIFSSHPISMISMDLSVAATSFLIFLIYKHKTQNKKITKYILSLFLVGFSLALPLYLYCNHDSE